MKQFKEKGTGYKEGTVVKRGKRRELHLHDEVDSETGTSYITDMFDKLFSDLNEGYIDTSDIIKYPDED